MSYWYQIDIKLESCCRVVAKTSLMSVWKSELLTQERGILGDNRWGLLAGVQPGDWKYPCQQACGPSLLESTARLRLLISTARLLLWYLLEAPFDPTAWSSESPRLNPTSSPPSTSRPRGWCTISRQAYTSALMLSRGLLSGRSLLHGTLGEELRTDFGMSDSTGYLC